MPPFPLTLTRDAATCPTLFGQAKRAMGRTGGSTIEAAEQGGRDSAILTPPTA